MMKKKDTQDTQKSERQNHQDERILAILKKDSRTPFMRIAEELGVAEGTMRNKVYRLQKRGVIKRFTVELGNRVSAIILVNIKTGFSIKETADKIRRMGASPVFEIAGKTDMVCFINTQGVGDTNTFVDKVREIEGVISTETLFVLR